MPQAAITAIGAWISSLGVATAVANFVATVFVYAASTYMLNRVAAALTPRARSNGLGSAVAANYYGPWREWVKLSDDAEKDKPAQSGQVSSARVPR